MAHVLARIDRPAITFKRASSEVVGMQWGKFYSTLTISDDPHLELLYDALLQMYVSISKPLSGSFEFGYEWQAPLWTAAGMGVFNIPGGTDAVENALRAELTAVDVFSAVRDLRAVGAGGAARTCSDGYFSSVREKIERVAKHLEKLRQNYEAIAGVAASLLALWAEFCDKTAERPFSAVFGDKQLAILKHDLYTNFSELAKLAPHFAKLPKNYAIAFNAVRKLWAGYRRRELKKKYITDKVASFADRCLALWSGMTDADKREVFTRIEEDLNPNYKGMRYKVDARLGPSHQPDIIYGKGNLRRAWELELLSSARVALNLSWLKIRPNEGTMFIRAFDAKGSDGEILEFSHADDRDTYIFRARDYTYWAFWPNVSYEVQNYGKIEKLRGPVPRMRAGYTLLAWEGTLVEELAPLDDTDDEYIVGIQIIRQLARLHTFALHSNITPETIAKSTRKGGVQYYLTDLRLSDEPVGDGFERELGDSVFADSRVNGKPMTWVDDIAELLYTLHALALHRQYHRKNTEGIPQPYGPFSSDRATRLSRDYAIFSVQVSTTYDSAMARLISENAYADPITRPPLRFTPEWDLASAQLKQLGNKGVPKGIREAWLALRGFPSVYPGKYFASDYYAKLVKIFENALTPAGSVDDVRKDFMPILKRTSPLIVD